MILYFWVSVGADTLLVYSMELQPEQLLVSPGEAAQVGHPDRLLEAQLPRDALNLDPVWQQVGRDEGHDGVAADDVGTILRC
jgi:hypothetical protein